MSETQQQTLAIEALVSRRCDELGLTQQGADTSLRLSERLEGLAAA